MRVLRFMALLLAAWCTMTIVHELGHVACGCAAGGTLRRLELLPWHLPYSLFDPNPYPLLTLWGGPVLGVLMPLIVAVVVRRDWMWFISHFCTLANGCYIATAWISGERYLDTPQLLAAGAPASSILLYCGVTIGVGYVGFRRQCIRALTPSTNRWVDSSPAEAAAGQSSVKFK